MLVGAILRITFTIKIVFLKGAKRQHLDWDLVRGAGGVRGRLNGS